ncbi:hypothetical protein GCM10008013_03820 [Paenibacillus segetis]|uniref:HTH araC/xylS-type domain-containing protein n=2 Tax=Paenibacillus segetis TaxID=1325360 RepID=A0ABQ1Y4G3_9BACL|nr:hypothetical protein GCM10008013_03820 [Paenibacillus segetis]
MTGMNHDYVERVNTVIQYIKDHSSERLTLDELAEQANFSKYHFSRIFSSLVGVSPVAFVNQVRLDNSLAYLTETHRTILDIAQWCGFESVITFNAAFKKRFNRTPSEVRAELSKNSNISLLVSKKQEELFPPLRYDDNRNTSNFLRRIWDMNISMQEIPEYEVAFVRHVGSYLDTQVAWNELGNWAFGHDLSPLHQYFIGISLDDPHAVEENHCRYDACVTLPQGFLRSEEGNIQFKRLAGGLCAVYSFYDTIDKLAIAYQTLYAQWLPNSEYDADDRPCLEFCMNDPAKDAEGKCKVDLYIPVKRRI